MIRAELLANAARKLEQAGIDDPMRDARILLRHFSGLEGASFSVSLREDAPDDELQKFTQAIERRMTREPVSHILGHRSFWGRNFSVSPSVLDPRPETEILIAAALEKPYSSVLDLGLGSGCILLTLLAENDKAKGVGIDISPEALALAQQNASALGVDRRCEMRLGNWLDGIEGQYDLIVSNPPYIPQADMAMLEPELAREPQMALTPGGDGLAPYRIIASGLSKLLAPKGRAFFEFGAGQHDDVAEIFAAEGFQNQKMHFDFDGRARCLEIQQFSA